LVCQTFHLFRKAGCSCSGRFISTCGTQISQPHHTASQHHTVQQQQAVALEQRRAMLRGDTSSYHDVTRKLCSTCPGRCSTRPRQICSTPARTIEHSRCQKQRWMPQYIARPSLWRCSAGRVRWRHMCIGDDTGVVESRVYGADCSCPWVIGSST